MKKKALHRRFRATRIGRNPFSFCSLHCAPAILAMPLLIRLGSGAVVDVSQYDTNPALEQLSSPTSLFQTPDYDSDPATVALGYRGQLAAYQESHLVNYYDAIDDALSAWRTNNQYFKPQPEFDYFTGFYYYYPNYPTGQALGISHPPNDRFVTTKHEAMAYVDQSRTLTVGAEGRTAGAISSGVDTDANYQFAHDHSAEWNFEIQKVQNFYYDVLSNFKLHENRLDSNRKKL